MSINPSSQTLSGHVPVCIATWERGQGGSAHLTHELYVLGLIRVFFHEELEEVYKVPAYFLGFDGGAPDKGLVLIIIAAARGSGKMDLKGTGRSVVCADSLVATFKGLQPHACKST